MNISDGTEELIRKSPYQKLREDFMLKAKNWNGVWKVWQDVTDPKFKPWSGSRVLKNQIVPENYRQLKYKEYEGIEGEIDNNIEDFKNKKLHTLGNENMLRRRYKNLNDALLTHFEPSEYKDVSTYTRNNYIKSYKVLLVKSDALGNEIETKIVWTPSYEDFDPSHKIKCYENKDLTKYIGDYKPKELKVLSSKFEDQYFLELKWTGERYYPTEIVSVNEKPSLIGNEISEDISKTKGVIKLGSEEPKENNFDKVTFVEYQNINNSDDVNQIALYTYDEEINNGTKSFKLNNDNLVKKSDYQEIQNLLGRITACLRLRDKWFDSNDRCSYSCQVNCQNRCQISCQGCNVKQCHNQKCGAH